MKTDKRVSFIETFFLSNDIKKNPEDSRSRRTLSVSFQS